MKFILSDYSDKHDKMQILKKYKIILYIGFRVTLKFWKVKVALNPMFRICGYNNPSKSTCKCWKLF